MNTFIRYAVPLVLFYLLSFPKTFAHCQVPCGIYDDNARVKMLLEDTNTLRKAVKEINLLSAKKKLSAQDNNQLVRWVMNKEKHAQNIISTISDYFLTQRVKAKQKDYSERLKKHHAVIVAAMKVKQSTDEKQVSNLQNHVRALLSYYPEHQHEHKH